MLPLSLTPYMSTQPSITSKTDADSVASSRTRQWLSRCPVGSHVALVGMGANLPAGQRQPEDTLQQALVAMRPLSLTDIRVSPFLITEPEDCPPGSPVFVNAVALLCCSEEVTAPRLLQSLLDLETSLGRKRSGLRNEPRVLDLDLLAFADQRCDDTFLTLPHPRAHLRRFVLQPLAEIWPAYCFPGQSRPVKSLLNALPTA